MYYVQIKSSDVAFMTRKECEDFVKSSAKFKDHEAVIYHSNDIDSEDNYEDYKDNITGKKAAGELEITWVK